MGHSRQDPRQLPGEQRLRIAQARLLSSLSLFIMSAVGQVLLDKFQNPSVLFKQQHQGRDSIEGSLVK